jgi:hypothetical protein
MLHKMETHVVLLPAPFVVSHPRSTSRRRLPSDGGKLIGVGVARSRDEERKASNEAFAGTSPLTGLLASPALLDRGC